jgi:dTDP-4-amino-4,6-dideoxygalactose transaminase
MIVPFFGFQDTPISILNDWKNAVERVLLSGVFIGGKEVEMFEQEWAEFLKIPYCVGVANGLDALTLALKSLGIGPGMKVAVPSHTYIATWIAVANVGAEPVGIDCGSDGLMDLSLLIDQDLDVQCVIPVHMHGQMVAMDRVMEWAKPRGIKVIEDCAQAQGAKHQGKFAGAWGDIGAFSFYPSKNLGAVGDAGAVVTSNKALAENLRSLGNYGSEVGNKYKYKFLGQNSRLDPIQAAVLRVNLRHLEDWNESRRIIAGQYFDLLDELGIERLSVNLRESVHHHCIVLAGERDSARNLLVELGVMTEIHYPESAEFSFNKLNGKVSTRKSHSDYLAKRTLSLPLTPWLTHEKIAHVVGSISNSRVHESLLPRDSH